MTTIEAPAASEPTPERPYWHDAAGERIAFGDVLAHAAPDEAAALAERHVEAVRALCRTAVEARLGDGNGTARTHAMAAGRLCQEVAGLWPSKTASR